MCLKTTHDSEMMAFANSARTAFDHILQAHDFDEAASFGHDNRAFLRGEHDVAVPESQVPAAHMAAAFLAKSGITLQIRTARPA